MQNSFNDFIFEVRQSCLISVICRCRIPRPQTSGSSSSQDESEDTVKRRESESQTRNLRSRRKRAAVGTSSASEEDTSRRKSPRKKGRGTSRQQEAADESVRKVAVVRPSNMKAARKKVAKRTMKGHKATAELEINPSQSAETGTVRITIEGRHDFY